MKIKYAQTLRRCSYPASEVQNARRRQLMLRQGPVALFLELTLESITTRERGLRPGLDLALQLFVRRSELLLGPVIRDA